MKNQERVVVIGGGVVGQGPGARRHQATLGRVTTSLGQCQDQDRDQEWGTRSHGDLESGLQSWSIGVRGREA